MKTFIAIKNDETRATFLTPENMALLKSFGEVREISGELSAQNAAAQIGDSDIYMTCWGSPRLEKAVLDSAPNMKLLVHLCGTVVPFVSEEMYKKGIRVISGNAFFARSTAEGALAYILAAQRSIPFYSTELKENRHWKCENAPNMSLIGKTVGLVSFGAVARNLAEMLQPFGVKLLVYDIVPIPEELKERFGITQVSLDELFSTADIISVHTPLNSETHRLIGAELFDKIKPDALFVNTSRGGIIDQNALIKALGSGRFRAVLDVYEQEPPAPDCRLYSAPNLIMMPHMGGPTLDLRSRIAEALIREAHGFIDCSEKLKNEIKQENAFTMSER